MPVSAIIFSQNPVVTTPKPAFYSLSLHRDGGIRFVDRSVSFSLEEMGWFVSAKFDIEGSQAQLSELFSNGLARQVCIYDEVAVERWQGIATTFTLKTSSTTRTVSLDDVANKITIRTAIDGVDGVRTDVQEDTDSQDRYGVLERVIQITKTEDGTGNADNVKEVAASNISNPYKMVEVQNKRNPSIPRGRAILSVGCSGYIFYLKRTLWNEVTKNTYTNASTIVTNMITDKGTFVRDSDIEEHTQQENQFEDEDEMVWTMILKMAGVSDSSNNKYIAGMGLDREFFYRKRIAATLENLHLTRDADGIMRDNRAGKISQIRITPDQYLRDTSIMNDPGKVYGNMRNDPQISYVQKVTYNNAADEAQISSVRITHRNRKLREALLRSIERRVEAEV